MKAHFGEDHLQTPIATTDVIRLYKPHNFPEKSAELIKQDRESHLRRLREGFPYSIDHLDTLAQIWRVQGRRVGAVRLLTDVTEVGRHILEPDHPAVVKSMGILARWKNEDAGEDPEREGRQRLE